MGNLSSGKSALVHRYLTGTYVQEESPEGQWGGGPTQEKGAPGGSPLQPASKMAERSDGGGIPPQTHTRSLPPDGKGASLARPSLAEGAPHFCLLPWEWGGWPDARKVLGGLVSKLWGGGLHWDRILPALGY